MRRAFTLIELLIVIGTVVLLVGMLFPVVIKSREAANRAACLSNLHQLGCAYLSYAQQNHDYIPIGYLSDQEQFNYVAHYNDSAGGWKSYSLLAGLLYEARLLPSPQTYYCPSQTNPQFQFGNNAVSADSNWWPFVTTNVGAKRHTRIAYGTRPVAAWHTVLVGSAYKVKYPSPMPRLMTYRKLAVLSDVVSTPSYLDQGHKKGINVLFGDTSARWVDRSQFGVSLRLIPNTSFDLVYMTTNPLFLDQTKKPPTGVWADLDRG